VLTTGFNIGTNGWHSTGLGHFFTSIAADSTVECTAQVMVTVTGSQTTQCEIAMQIDGGWYGVPGSVILQGGLATTYATLTTHAVAVERYGTVQISVLATSAINDCSIPSGQHTAELYCTIYGPSSYDGM
jgi:hypothetical protein